MLSRICKFILTLGVVVALLLQTVYIPTALAREPGLPKTVSAFSGEIGKTYKDSTPDFPKPITAPTDAPNVLLILIDDLGFGAPSTFGGLIDTPNLDRLAENGLRFNRFHTTALCSPTRAALLTGRNHHQVGTGIITELATGFPGYNSFWDYDNASIAEVLKDNGYNTAMFGKWHNTPDFETSPTGPFDRWPTGKGFEYFYGFQGGETSQWEPQLYRNTTPIEPYAKPEAGYHLSVDIADQAIDWIRLHDSIEAEKPWFIYWAPGASHAPHHVPQKWIDEYKGKFDMGWDKYRKVVFQRQKAMGLIPENTLLTPRPEGLPAWDSLSGDEQKLFARQMAVYAAFTSHLDAQIGRLLDAVDHSPNGKNTMVIAILGDNGSSAEGGLTGTINNMATQNGFPDNVQDMLKVIDEIGGPKHENHFAVAWAWATDSPFQWTKQVASHFGGTRNGVVISWPQRIVDHGGLRDQFHHVTDIAPTIYEAAGVEFPAVVNGVEQVPLAGVSMTYTFDNVTAPDRRTTQYFEMFGNRAIYDNGWLAAARHGVPWVLVGKDGNFEADQWELYNLEEDFSEAVDLADENPEKLAELQSIFDSEASKYQVFPLDDRFAERAAVQRPSVTQGKTSFTYYPGAERIPEGSAPNVKARSHVITADLEIPDAGSEGVVVAHGGSGGYTLYVKDGKLVYENNFFGRERDRIISEQPLPKGAVKVAFAYTQESDEYGGGGTGRLYINDELVGKGTFEHVVPARYSATETFDVGKDLGAAVSLNYETPFAFTGTINWVTVDLK